MKRKLLFLQCLMLGIALFCSVGAKAQTMPHVTLSGDPNSITPVIFTAGSSENVAYLYATDVATFCGMQVDLILPEGVSIIKKENSTLTKDEEGENIHTVQYSDKGAEGWRLLIYTSELIKFNGNNGALAKLTFSVSSSFVGGKAKFKDGIFTDPEIKIEDSEVTIYETSNPSFGFIKFADANVKAKCVANWDTNSDGELSYDEAKAVTDLGDVFSNDSTITSFNELQNFTGLTSIGTILDFTGNFEGCSKLTGLTLPSTVKTIGKRAFANCTSLSSITILGPVTSIGQGAFQNCSSLAGFPESDSLETIGDYAFCGCRSFKEVTLPNSAKTIGESAFSECEALKSLALSNSVTTISDYAFEDCPALTRVTIPYSVISIGKGIFAGCTALEQINVNSENTKYDSRSNCNAIIETATNTLIAGCKKTTIPNDVTAIGESAFYNCTGLSSIDIPESVTAIKSLALGGCSDLSEVWVYWHNPPTIDSRAFNGVDLGTVRLHVPVGAKQNYASADVWKEFIIVNDVTSVNIQFADAKVKAKCVANWDDNHDGELSYEEAAKVFDLGNVFSKDSTITSFDELEYFTDLRSIGTILDNIGNFQGCTELKSIKLPNKVETIGTSAFSGCTFLKNIYIPNSVTTIGMYSFNGCDALTDITLPDYLETIGDYAFSGCSNLKEVIMPNSVKNLGESAFLECKALRSVAMSNSLTTINDYVFEDCIALTSVTIPNSVISIGKGIFAGCTALDTICVENGNTKYDSRSNCNAIIETATNTLVFGCKTTIIPDNVTVLGESAFYNCKGLSSIDIPESVTEIRSLALGGCSNLSEVWVYWHNPITIDSNAFNGIDLGTVTLHIPLGAKQNYVSADVWKEFTIVNDITSVKIPFADANVKAICVANWDTNGDGELSYDEAMAVTELGGVFEGDSTITSFNELQYFTGLTSIGNRAFRYCSSLTSISIPNSVTSIGAAAFEGCSGLTSVAISNSVTSIADYTFCLCSSLTSVTIPNSVTSIGSLAFYGCSGLTSVTIPNRVTSIGESAFKYCSGLTSIIIPNSVTSIGSSAFSDCSGLTSITIPDSVTSIGDGAFCNCSGLTSVAISNSVTSIGPNAFYGCSALTSVVIPNSVTSIENYTFCYCSSLISVTIPNSVTSIGAWAFSDCSGLTSVTIPNSVTSIGEGAFAQCSGLTSITISNNVTSIAEFAFCNCSGLTSVTIPNSVTSIGEHAFSQCSGLTSVTIPNSVTSIGYGAFGNCSSLTSITIPNSVTSIGNYAFNGCFSLTSIAIPNSVTSIGESAFAECSALESITIPNSVDAIGDLAFRQCYALKDIYVDWEMPLSIADSTFIDIPANNVMLHVPVYTKRKYAAAEVWEDFGRIISFNDVNMDGQLTVADVTGVKNFILGVNTDSLWAEAADVNEDSKYLVDDLKDEVDLVLMGLTLAKDENNAKGEMNWANIVFAKSDDGELVVCTNDVGRYVGIQFDLMLPDDVELINTRTGKGAAGYAVRSQKLDNGMTRVIAYAMNTNTINDTEVLRLKFRSTDGSKDKVCDVTLHEISLSTPNALAVGSRDIDATVTLNEATGINSIYGDSNADAIYNMQGQKLVKAQRGINLTNGKKFIKR